MPLLSLLLGIALLAVFAVWNFNLLGTSVTSPTTEVRKLTQTTMIVNDKEASPLAVPGMAARNQRRTSDVAAIANALVQYSLEKGAFPPGVSAAEMEICKQGAVSCAGFLDLSVLTESALVAIPSDPQVATTNGTGYAVMAQASRVTVRALHAEGGVAISVTK